MIQLRAMERGDIERLAEIEKLCFKKPWSRDSFERELKNAIAYYVIALEDGVIAGYAGIWMIFEEGSINNIAVIPEARRRGIGKMLLENVMDKARREGVTEFMLEVRPSNEAARALYAQYGFCEYGKRKKYYGDEDAILMRRSEHGTELEKE